MDKEFILLEYIKEFLRSDERRLMMDGERYYRYENDVLRSRKKSKLVHGFITNLVDEKVSYLLGKPFSFDCANDEYVKNVSDVLGTSFQYLLNKIAIEASNKGIAWLHPYIDDSGEFKMLVIPSEQCCPIWKDNARDELEGMLRVYDEEVYEGRNKKFVSKVEYYTSEDVTYYIYVQDRLILDSEKYLKLEDNEVFRHFKRGQMWTAWDRVPFVWFRNNMFEIPDLKSVKTLIDDYDVRRSDISEIIDECKNYINVLRGYGGTSKQAFYEATENRFIKLDDPEGGIDILTPMIDNEAAKQHFEQLKRDIQHFGQGVNKDSDAIGNSPSGIALKFLYSGLDLKCYKLETEMKQGFDNLMYFVNRYLAEAGQSVPDEVINIVFNRDIAINESDSITQCQQSLGIISEKTVVANHPWVKDVDEEIEQKRKENEEKLESLPVGYDGVINSGEGDEE